MTEPPRPPGADDPNDPTTPFQQPAGGYPPPPPYTPPAGGPSQYGPPYQPGYSSPHDERNWIQIAHFGGAIGAFLGGGCAGWIAPLVALLSRGNQSPAVRAEAIKALNFQLTWTIVAVIGYFTVFCLIGFLIFPAAILVGIIFGLIAGVKAANGEPYNYPLSITMIR